MAHYIQLEDLSPAFSRPSSIAETLHSYSTYVAQYEDSLNMNDTLVSRGRQKSQELKRPRFSTSAFVSRISAVQEHFDVDWTWETVCVIVRVLSFSALAIVFKCFNGKPLQDWTFYLSLNTVASILGTLGKSSLLLAVSAAIGQGKWLWFQTRQRPLIEFDTFDEASRGPLGSLKLLWRTRARYVKWKTNQDQLLNKAVEIWQLLVQLSPC